MNNTNTQTIEKASAARIAHTPGTWFVEGDGYTIAAAKPERMNTPIAYTPLEYPNREVNARLIAAAPDLLEACKLALKCDQAELDGYDQFDDGMDVAALRSNITTYNAAIRKATGQ